MSTNWLWEAQDQRPDPETGAQIFHLTSSPSVTFAPDGESPVASPDGNRVLLIRSRDVNLDPERALLVSDLRTKRLAYIDRLSVPGGLFTAGWGGFFAYMDSAYNLKRVDWDLLEPELWLTRDQWESIAGLPTDLAGKPAWPGRGGCMTPDGRYLFYVALLPGPCPALIRIDTRDLCAEVMHRQPDMINPHLQTEPVYGRWVMMQVNTDARLAPDGIPLSWGNAPTQLLVQSVDGGAVTKVYGEAGTPDCTGHECFIPGEGKIMMSADWPAGDARAADATGNLAITAVDGSGSHLLNTRPFQFFHVGPSRCGRYFVADELYGWPEKPPALVVGSLKTGKCRYLLRDCGCYGCGGQVTTQPRPVFMADNQHVVFGRSPFGLTQAAAVRLPDNFLEELDQ